MITLTVPFGNCSPIEAAIGVAKYAKRPFLPNLPDDMHILITDCWKQEADMRPPIQNVKERVQAMIKKKSSYGSIEISTKTVDRKCFLDNHNFM